MNAEIHVIPPSVQFFVRQMSQSKRPQEPFVTIEHSLKNLSAEVQNSLSIELKPSLLNQLLLIVR